MITWILVCDAACGRLFKTTGRPNKISLVQEFIHPQSRNKGSDLISDRPGSAPGVHGGVPLRTDPKEVQMNHFAQEMARLLNKGQGENAYNQLILVAPPQFLGMIKGHLSPAAKKQIAKTIDKDFSHLKEQDLIRSLEKYWPEPKIA